jgi:hypothetical protein
MPLGRAGSQPALGSGYEVPLRASSDKQGSSPLAH